jgi:PhnB protein
MAKQSETTAVLHQHADAEAVPDGHRDSATPCILARGAARLIDFLKRAFGATEVEGRRVLRPDGKIARAEVRIGDSTVMLFDTVEDAQPTPSFLRLFVADCDRAYEHALKEGACAVTKPTVLAFGNRAARVRDPGGNVWWIHTHDEQLAPSRIAERSSDKKWVEAMEYV